MPGVLVLITGTGRSGTSTMSGTFHHLGLHVPGPYLGSNESNPKGFFESKWSVRFHNKLAERAGIHIFDGRPTALARVQAAIKPRDREQLATFVAEVFADHDQVVVKDPRTVWVQNLWREIASARGVEIRYVSMLRHPAEVVGSRTTYYSRHADAADPEAEARRYAIFNVARWINASLINERETRGQSRAFVRYTDLLDDWRPVVAGLRDDLGLRIEADLTPGVHSPVDDFIEPGLRRHAVTWDELEIPRDLRDVAQDVWDQHQLLCDGHGVDEGASARLDELSAEYERVLFDAAAINQDARDEAVVAARRRGAAEARDSSLDGPLEDRPVAAVSGRDLLKLVGRRAAGRFARGRS